MLSEAVSGERIAQAGSMTSLRSDKFSALVTTPAHGQYFESARLSRIFSTFVKTVTVAATHNTPIAANTATPVLGIMNVSTDTAASILRVSVGTTSGTPAGGQVVLNVIPNAYPIITAAATGSIFSHMPQATASPQGSKMRALNGVALGGWVSTLTTMELLHVGQATAAAVAGNGGPNMTAEDLAGTLIIPPNCLLAVMAGTGAGTSWIVNGSLTWEEVPWPVL